jgi:hypothetical protein
MFFLGDATSSRSTIALSDARIGVITRDTIIVQLLFLEFKMSLLSC